MWEEAESPTISPTRMSEHFRAFSFVDRIISVEPGVSISGEYQIPGAIDSFSSSLVAESLGQLAAWSAMAKIDFQFRPVAGIAGGTDFLAAVKPGQILQLSAQLDQSDEEAVSYGGIVKVNGEEVLRLENCLGPMVPMSDYDDPQAMRDRYDLIRHHGAEPNAFGGVPELSFIRNEEESVHGESTFAAFTVPESAPFFGDHFPRNPVFPGTLLMDTNRKFAETLASEIPLEKTGHSWKVSRMGNVKIRAFTPPGEALELRAKIDEKTEDSLTIRVETKKGGKRNSSAKVHFRSEC